MISLPAGRVLWGLAIASAMSAIDPPAAPTNTAPDVPETRDSALMPADQHSAHVPFRPSLHGFHFRNGFDGSPIPARYRSTAALLGVDTMVGDTTHYGLCGGMAAAAADFYFADRDPPARTTRPGDDDPLFMYLSDRQLDSLGPGLMLALKFAEWMTYRDHDTDAKNPGASGADSAAARGWWSRPDIGLKTAEALPAIYDKLDNGELVVLGLVLTSPGEGRLWDNHQVLAYGYDRDDQKTWIKIYDSNYPDDDGAAIVIRSCGEGTSAVRCELAPSKRRARPVRGLFEMPYTAKVPPGELTK